MFDGPGGSGWARDSMFDFAYQRVPGGVFTLTVHPQTIGRAHAFLMFERFVEYVVGHEGAWVTTLSEIAATWYDR
jgi:peptidoglycan-N-acetylglucosamine deacetylase